MNTPAEFDEIRPYNPEELPAIFEELLADPDFRTVIEKVFPNLPYEVFSQELRLCKTGLDVEKKYCYPFLMGLVNKYSLGLQLDCSSIDSQKGPYTFISNHRDIILDSAFLSILLIDKNFPTTVEIAIGDNLLIKPWIKKTVRVTKSFIVQRAISMRQILLSSARLSRYLHYAVGQKKENIWIAQREGRAKDSNDRTQDSILKMMVMGTKTHAIQSLKSLHLVPTCLSYEYDPCDYLKAQEFQQKRDIADFKKSKQSDLDNMRVGIFGYKGHIHFQTGECLDNWLDTLNPETPKNELYTLIAAQIDKEIHSNYKLYPGNYVAADLLEGKSTYTSFYTEAQKLQFEKYVESQLKKVQLENPDWNFLRERILLMYANPTFNHTAALKK